MKTKYFPASNQSWPQKGLDSLDQEVNIDLLQSPFCHNQLSWVMNQLFMGQPWFYVVLIQEPLLHLGLGICLWRKSDGWGGPDHQLRAAAHLGGLSRL